MNRNLTTLVIFLSIFLETTQVNASSFQVIEDGIPFFKSLDERRHVVFKGRDPNFPLDELHTYEGVELSEVLWPEATTSSAVITVIATDQYILHGRLADVLADGPVLVNRANGAELAKARGGPLSLMWRGTRPREHFIWYVKTIAIGEFDLAHLSVERQGSSTTLKLKSLETTTYERHLPIPRGVRHLELSKQAGFAAVRLTDLLGGNQGAAVDVHAKNLASAPYAEPLSNSLWLAVSKGDRPIPLAEGGPFVLFSLNSKGVFERVQFFVTGISFSTGITE